MPRTQGEPKATIIKNVVAGAAIITALAMWLGFYLGFEEGHKAGASWQMKSLSYALCLGNSFQEAGGRKTLELSATPIIKGMDPLDIARISSAKSALWKADEKCRNKLGIDDEFWKRRIRERKQQTADQ